MSALKDLKEALSSGRKPDLTHVRTPLMVYVARNSEYGNAKYERANYLRTTPTLRDDFNRLRTYARATIGHVLAMLDAMERHQAEDPELKDEAGMKEAVYAIDTDETPGAKVGASKLPHIGGAAASLNMLLAQAVEAGLLPADPGRPWETTAERIKPTQGRRRVLRHTMKPGERGQYVDGPGRGGPATGDVTLSSRDDQAYYYATVELDA